MPASHPTCTTPRHSRVRFLALALASVAYMTPLYVAHAETGAPAVTGTPKVATGARINPGSTSVGADVNVNNAASTTIPSSARQPGTNPVQNTNRINPGNTTDTNADGISDARDGAARTDRINTNATGTDAGSDARINSTTTNSTATDLDDVGGSVRADTTITKPPSTANRSDTTTPMRSDLRGTTRPAGATGAATGR